MNRKIKIFLGAYVNYPNAQNINCDNIARYLDKGKFEVYTMYTNKMPINKEYYYSLNVHLYELIHHRYIWFWSKLIAMLFARCDIYYLPKGEEPDKVLAKLLKGKAKLISSVEGVICEMSNNTPDIRDYHLKRMDSCFAISKCIEKSVEQFWNSKLPVLPLGVRRIEMNSQTRTSVNSIVWVGNIKANKRPQWLIECAKDFPELSFTMIGDGDMESEIDDLVADYSLTNVRRTGRVQNNQVYQYMAECDLLLMTSEYEGLPKVIQEAAQCGVPSIYVNKNYSVDFITDGLNGYEVKNLDEMKERIRYLLENPEQYKRMSVAASESIKPYLWPTLIKQYEEYFESLVESK